MNDEQIQAYCIGLGMPKALIERAKLIHALYGKLGINDISDVFISEYVKEDGERSFENLWFFADKHVMEAKQFATEIDLDMAPSTVVSYIDLKQTEYDLEHSTGASRLFVTATLPLGMGVGLTFKASRENCDYLKTIVIKYLMPRLQAPS
ncbi:MAG TPA: hypothetical protein VFH00_01600 [Candidatus Nitrosotalea sp.]|nr:hypothetical protein [Candidatus Nitrosotalea sp.]